MELTKRLLELSDAYCAARGVSDATVSGIIFKDSRKLSRLRNGGDITIRRYEKAIYWFSKNWPENCKRPDCIPREELRPDLFRREEERA